MALIRKAIPGLYDGVSQQSPTLRSPLQASIQENCWATIADGLRKRPPTELVGKLSSTPIGKAYLHEINRDTTERYQVIISDGDIKVFDVISGTEQVVNFPSGKAYLSCDNPVSDFQAVTVADYTFIVNKTVAVAMMADAVAVPSVQYWLNWNQYGGTPNYTYPSYTSGSYRGEMQAFEDLPDTANVGDVYKITGTNANDFNAFWVKRVGGVWEESRDPFDNTNKLNPETLPWALIREANGEFTFATFSWAERKVGDDGTNPEPTFVGRNINDVLFVQNRLGFLVDENVILSATGDFGNFWRNTVTTVVASDPVDVAVTGKKVSILKQALPFNDSIVLFADQTQFVMTWGREGLTPESVALTPVTGYTVNLDCQPILIGRDVYFAANSAGYSRVYEYYNRSAGEGQQTKAADITGHVPRYVPKSVSKLAGDPTSETLFVITPEAPNEVYLYKYTWGGAEEKIQSAWSHWIFPTDCSVLSISILDEYIYLIMERADGVYVERINLNSGAVPELAYRELYLDQRVAVTGTYLSGSDTTTFTLPYVPSDAATFALVCSNEAPIGKREARINPEDITVSGTTVTVNGDYSGYSVYAGSLYNMRYRFSPQFLVDNQGSILSGRTILRGVTVYFTDTAYFRTSVDPYGVDAEEIEIVPSKLAEWTGKTIGDEALIIGEPSYKSGDYTFQVYGEADTALVELSNNSHVASTFQSAELELTYVNRAR